MRRRTIEGRRAQTELVGASLCSAKRLWFEPRSRKRSISRLALVRALRRRRDEARGLFCRTASSEALPFASYLMHSSQPHRSQRQTHERRDANTSPFLPSTTGLPSRVPALPASSLFASTRRTYVGAVDGGSINLLLTYAARSACWGNTDTALPRPQKGR